MTEFTILDAPETPAPVFAFRALKGAIFGSPNDDEERKENVRPSIHVPTLRSKISALRAPSLSPSKRRKTNSYASPAKSILRTPGIPTPRKQNIAVTFKDVTPSLSPELMRKNPTPKKQPLSKDVESAKNIQLPSATQAPPAPPQAISVNATKPGNGNITQAVQTGRAPEHTMLAFDFEAYRLSTEKEMKKLVRYGQKMKEYAREQSEENTKLKIVLETLQKEIEELRHREKLRDRVLAGKVVEVRKKDAGAKALTAQSGRKPIPTTVVAKTTRYSADPAGSKAAKPSAAGNSPVTSNSLQKQGQSSPLKRKASTQLNPKQPPAHESKFHGQLGPQAVTQAVHENTAPPSGSASARLPQERIAAARERIRLKAERRKTTTANTSSPVNWNAL